MDDEGKQTIVSQAAAMDTMFKTSQIGLDVFGKWMVKLAYDLVFGDELQLAVGVCQQIPDEYFEKVHAGQMVSDEEFARMSGYLAKRFRIHGVVPQDLSVNILPRIGVA